ncbi:MAG TPA: hypothetical protein VK590_02090 [Saprospiraceae bacterium]|nr:hypothetical protein [Saprospiraceae bacterium]
MSSINIIYDKIRNKNSLDKVDIQFINEKFNILTSGYNPKTIGLFAESLSFMMSIKNCINFPIEQKIILDEMEKFILNPDEIEKFVTSNKS